MYHMYHIFRKRLILLDNIDFFHVPFLAQRCTTFFGKLLAGRASSGFARFVPFLPNLYHFCQKGLFLWFFGNFVQFSALPVAFVTLSRYSSVTLKKQDALNMIKFFKHHELSEWPVRGSELAAGYDLFSTHKVILLPGERVLIDTGICAEFGPNVVGLIRPRSGLAVDRGIDVMAGVIDSDYRGTIKVLLVNHGSEPLLLPAGWRVAQILFMPVIHDVVNCEGRISETERGTNGFGSTGV